METMKRDSRRIYNLIHFFARVYEEKAKRLLRVIFSDSIFYKYDWKQDQELEEYRKKDQLVYDNLVDFLKSEKLWKDTKS